MRILFLLSLLLLSHSATASQLTTLGPHNKSTLLDNAAPKQKHKFPALYVYDTNKQEFLTKSDAAAYLQTLDNDPLLVDLTVQWTKSTELFSTNNDMLAKSLPTLQLDKPYLILYDNLPTPMLSQFEAMVPNLKQKDALIRALLSENDNARSYSTY
ncbi:hypothetical protein TUM4438_07850 [Shewanella sairae]|uniref:Uncharacterized protein n=1 Tax=Shewanella sairae TaxID=190310 RepID=A0ABQ4P3K3_9GAMM|nr:hypothetical protein [Shewanella sairae]MCL1128540.1 hypothetical protein [Shewanella sairae]GIU42094.1 hypothetical protein TUM4438_07850 [Shewanella sairae]